MHDHRRPRGATFGLLVAVLGATGLVAACSAGSGAAGSSAPTPPSTTPPSAAPGGATSRERAIAMVLGQDPRFVGIGPVDPGVIGQSAWYEVTPGMVGWRVVVTRGWGDCQAGCISRHTWTYEVDGGGTVTLVSEGGDPLPDGSGAGGSGSGGSSGIPPSPPVAIPAEGGPWIAGRAMAGPVCPVVQNPPDPACADRPVGGAVVLVRNAGGAGIARVTTSPDGTYLAGVPGAGTFTVEGQPVEGLMGTPAAVHVAVPDGPAAWVVADLTYDTGIR
jgi:hypothetical protein